MGCLKSDDKFVDIITQRISESFELLFNVHKSTREFQFYKIEIFSNKAKRKICQAMQLRMHSIKRMLTSGWSDIKGVIYCELPPKKATINTMMYCQQLIKLEAEFVANKGLFSGKIFFSTTIPNVVNVARQRKNSQV